MGAMEELEQLAEEHSEIKEIVYQLKMVEEMVGTTTPEEELESLVEYFKAKLSGGTQLEQLEIDNKFKLRQIEKLVNIIDLDFEEYKEMNKLLKKLNYLLEKHKKVDVLSERLIVNERFSNLLDEVFEILILRAGQ